MEQGRILILEDDEALRTELAELLGDEGYQVETAGRGEQAVALARSEPFDLIVADIRMEGMSGLDALERVKQDAPGIGSMVITGYSTEADSIRAIQLGVGNYLKKPFHMRDFLKSVQDLMVRRREEQKLVAREKALRHTALWALETVARSNDLASGTTSRLGGLVEAGRTAARLSVALGLGPAQAEETQAAWLAASMEECPEFLTQGLPDPVYRIRREVAETPGRGCEGGGPPLPGLQVRIVRTLLCIHRDLDEPGDPEVLEALDRLAPAAEEDPASAMEQARRRRGLVSLGQTLLERGDPDSAARSFEGVLELEPVGRTTREGVEALLGLSGAALARRQPDQAARQALEAAERARTLFPSARGLAELEAALILLQLGRQEGLTALDSARQVLSGLGPSCGLARANLAAARFAGTGQELTEELRFLS
ncbi:MAG: response regulator, partial [Candidatus Eremiobacterota bacterium]